MDSTSVTLLERVKARSDADAWERLVALITPLLRDWARWLGADEEDAEDLVQEVMAVLVVKLPEFSYDRDKSFRGWLRTIATNIWRGWQRRRGAIALEDAGLEDRAGDDPAEEFWEQEFRERLVGLALKIMRRDFEPTTWKACWESVAMGRAAAEVAAELGISRGAVYVATSRVLKRLRAELAEMME